MLPLPRFLRTAWRRPAALLGPALLALTLACGGGGGGGGSTPPPTPQPYAELLFVADATSIRTVNATGTTRTELSTATLPGIPGTYSRTGSLVTVTMKNHQVRNGLWMDLVFSAGTGGTATSGKYRVTVVDDNTFTLTDPASGTITGGTMYRKPGFSLTGTYAQAGTTVTVTIPGHGLAVNDQVDLAFTSGTGTNTAQKITAVTNDTFTLTHSVSATTSGNVTASFGTNYSIFDLAMHPSGKWLYVASFYDCGWGRPYCWGGDVIHRFAINWTTGALTHEAAVHAPANDKYDAPVTLAFSPDGTRMYNQDDNWDGLRMWNVDTATGALTYVAQSQENVSGAHGVVVSTNGSRVYHGNSVYTPTATTFLRTTAGANYDNSHSIIGNNLFGVGVDGEWSLRVYSLANPDAPSLITSASTKLTNQARSIALNATGSRIVASGWGGLKSWSFDGAAFTPVALAAGELRDGGSPWPTGGTRRMYRTISMNSAGNLLASAYFTNYTNTPSGAYKSGPPSGYILASLAADGSLALVSDTTNMTYARVARFFKKP